jgi:quaternary ammonium compound-resistance protein SugE
VLESTGIQEFKGRDIALSEPVFVAAPHHSIPGVAYNSILFLRWVGGGMAWAILFVAGLFEVAWAIGLKYTEGFTRLWPTLGTVAAMFISVALLGVAMKTLPVGTSYAVWVGVGAVGTAILGIVLLGESANAGRLFSLALIVAGIVGLKLATSA